MPNSNFALLRRSASHADLTPTHHLPTPLTPLLGREQELAQLMALLYRPETRLLTLTGPGGVGKTRLLLAVAHDLVKEFTNGIYLVPLAALSDPGFVLPAIAQTLGLREEDTCSLLEQVQRAVDSQPVLLLLDNFEHVRAAAPSLTELLAACPNLHLLVTSRAALRIYGEQEFAVSPLPLPDLKRGHSHSTLSHYAALTLFVQRAQAITPTFQLTSANVYHIAEICIRLDGLPLAIELAAARTRLLSPRALLTRLERRLEVLSGGAHTTPDRHRTLRATLAWSYHLLAPQEQQLFRTLSIFAGGCTLQAAETLARVAGLAACTVLDGVSILLENHLLFQEEQIEGEPRLFMLETIREYGLECLHSSGELADVQQAHMHYYLALAKEAEARFSGPEQVCWFDCLDQELENLRTVLQRATIGEDQAIEDALRLGTALAWFWYVRGHTSDGHRWLEWMQTQRQRGTTVLAQALNQAARLAIWRDDYELAHTLSSESLAVYRETGDIQGMASALFSLADATQDRSNYSGARALYQEAARLYQQGGDQNGYASSLAAMAYGATNQGDFPKARALAEEALILFEERGDKQGMLYALVRLVRCLYLSQADPARAKALARRCLEMSREIGYKQGVAASLSYLGLLFLERGEEDEARFHLEEAFRLRQELSSPWGITRGRYYLAGLSQIQHDYAKARTMYETCLQELQEMGDLEFTASCLEELAAVVIAQRVEERTNFECLWAGHLWGTAESLRECIEAPLPPVRSSAYEQAVALARRLVEEPAWDKAWTRGRAMTPEQVLSARPTTIDAVTSIAAVVEKQPCHPVSLFGATENPLEASIPLDLDHERANEAAGSISRPSKRQPSSPIPAGLTRRELDVLRLLADGLSNREIADHLVISPRTVDGHLVSIYSKLHVSSRTAAAHYVHEHRLL